MKNGRSVFRNCRSLVFTVIVALAPTALKAQTATVSGTVLDSSGAVMSGATVTATNVATGLERSTESTDTGAYTIPSLPPSIYTVSFSKPGFKTTKFDGIALTVDQVLTLDCKFEVGAISTTVEVNSSAVAPIDTETPTLSNVVEHTQMVELPLILRDPYQLVLLGPGVTQSDSSLGGVSINGGRERNNNFLLDGTDNNDADVPGALGGLTAQNPDSTQEFRVLTNNFAPEYGRNNGAIIDVITRSGTNDYHGNLFYFGRWDALGARDYFNHQIDPVTGDIAPKNPYVRNLYGGSFGGPIKKDKTFFFINYQGDRFVTSLTNTTTVPTAAFKSGVFTYTNPTNGATQTLNVTTPGTANNGTMVGLDPSVQQILSFYPAPNVVNADGITGLLFFPTESRQKDEDATIKIDQKLGKTSDLYVRYVFNWFHDPDPFHSDTLPDGIGATAEAARTQSLSIGLTSTFGATLSNEFRFGANRNNSGFTCNGSLADTITNSTGNFIDPTGRGADFSLPGLNAPGEDFGCASLGDSNSQDRHTGTYQYLDYMTKVVGSHTIKWGGEFRDVYSNNNDNFSSRQAFTFNVNTDFGAAGTVLMNVNPLVDNQTLEDEVSGLLGIVAVANQTQYFDLAGNRHATDELNFVQHEVGGFIQDVWKFKSNISITYGMRYEWYGVPYERNGELSNLFVNPSGPAPFTFTPVGPGTGQQLYKDYYSNFEPRLGFAWDPFKDGKTSVRGGFGVFSDRVYGNLFGDARGNPPFQPSYFNFPIFTSGLGPGTQLQNQTAPPQLVPSAVVQNEAGTFPDIFSNNVKPPIITTWNLGVQRELAKNLIFEANYVGNHGTRILRVVDAAPPQPGLVAELEAYCIPTNPLNTVGCSESTLQFGNLYFGQENGVLPFDAVNNNAFEDAFFDESSGHSWYDGLQIQVTERNFHGLQIQGSYTYSHALDDSSDPLVTTTGNGNFPIDSFDLKREKGNSGFDTRHRGVINFVYPFNIGRGRARFTEGVVGRVLEGWQLSGIAAFQTGLPYDIFGIADTLHTNFADRATVINPSILKATPAMGSFVPSTAVFTGENPAAFNPDNAAIMPIPFDIPSNVGRNHWYGPGINNWNLNLAKTTAINERINFQLRFEVYNVFNRTQFAKPDDVIGDPNFGYSTSQVGQNDGTTGARQIQIGGKLNF
jgi:hypothetical protein